MTKDEMRQKVAEACGWKLEDYGHSVSWVCPKGSGWFTCPPDYPHDLNACHEMEKTLTGNEWSAFDCELESITWRDRDPVSGVAMPEWHATARQRCEAFLRVKGLWKD